MDELKKTSSLAEKIKSISLVFFVLIWLVLCVAVFVFRYSYLWAPHIHAWSEWTVLREATCTEAGEKTRSCECAETQTESIAATGHSMSDWQVVKAATCTEQGEQMKTCACGERETEVIAATGHTMGDWQVVKVATCTEDGERAKICACGERETESIAATGHSMGDWQVVKAATCTEQGERAKTCACGERETEAIAMIAHSYGAWQVVKVSTKYEDGEQQAACTVCGTKKSEAIAATGSLGLEYTKSGSTYTVSGIGTCTDTDVVIPRIYNGCAVVKIESRAFERCKNLTSVTIPSSVTSIGTNPICGCTALQKIEVSSENLNYHVNGNCLIETKTGRLVSGLNTSVIPSDGSVTSIGDYAFEYCSGLTNITIPNGVTSIGSCAFWYCEKITSITIPNGVTSIGRRAFWCCEKITSITLPNSVTSIGDHAFGDCFALTSITLPNSLTSIGDLAFFQCELTSITIPSSVTSIGDNPIRGCSIEKIEVTPGNSNYYVSGNCLIETKTGRLVSGCKTSVIPTDGSVTSIGEDAFAQSGLTSITLPNSVTSIGSCAFMNCALVSITIPNSVTSIADSAFLDCSALTSITIPSSVTSISGNPISGCNAIQKIEVSSGNPNYHVSGNCLIETKTDRLVSGCNNSVIPADGSVTSIGYSAFANFDGLTNITIPISVTSIADQAFINCNNLTSITYTGTKAQWNAISKGRSWTPLTPSYTIHCTDGDIVQ